MSETKLEILEAAGRVVLEQGVGGLTLEAVSHEAGLSKGGLLYHYGTKEALLAAMVDRLVEVTEGRIATVREDDSGPGSWMRGYLNACLVDDQHDTDPTGRLGVAVLAAGATDPQLLERLRERQQTWRRRIRDDGIDEVTALIVRLAADGLWMNDIFALPVLNQKERRAVLQRLASLTRD